jgi:Flp pilus assembly pilin Flp
MNEEIDIETEKNLLKEESGQTLLEFVLLLVVIMILSFGMLKGINKSIGVRWVALVKLITEPTVDRDQIALP